MRKKETDGQNLQRKRGIAERKLTRVLKGGGEGTKQQTILIDAENRYF